MLHGGISATSPLLMQSIVVPRCLTLSKSGLDAPPPLGSWAEVAMGIRDARVVTSYYWSHQSRRPAPSLVFPL